MAVSEPAALELPPDWLRPGAPPLAVDVGCHRGAFLVALAAQFPAWNHLGIERLSERVERTLGKIRQLGLSNAHALRAEGAAAVGALPAGRAVLINVLFPDPWPKRRHAGRRLINPTFLASCARALAHGGHLRILTDDDGYAGEIGACLEPMTDFHPDQEPEFPTTAFERKFLGQGKHPHRWFLRRLLLSADQPQEDFVVSGDPRAGVEFPCGAGPGGR